MLKGLFFTPLQEKREFKKYGENFKFVEFNEETGLYLYKRDSGWEVFKPLKRKQPDGSMVEIYPTEEDFGVYGLCFSSEEWARLCLKLGFEKWAEWKTEWRKTKMKERREAKLREMVEMAAMAKKNRQYSEILP